MRYAISLSVRSATSPKIASLITLWRLVSSRISGRSASTGKVVIRSTSAFTSSSTALASAPSSSCNTTVPKPSAAVEVISSIPSTDCTCSSILSRIDSSTSSGVAPGYGTETRIMSRLNSGKTSCTRAPSDTNPAMITKIMSRFAATLCFAMYATGPWYSSTVPHGSRLVLRADVFGRAAHDATGVPASFTRTSMPFVATVIPATITSCPSVKSPMT